MQVALFGGSFNPPHVAHVLAVAYVLSTTATERVLVIPVYSHPFDKTLAPFDDRIEMTRLALGWLPNTEVSSLEAELEPPSYTLKTVERIHAQHPDWSLRLVIGADVLPETDKWHCFETVQAMAPPLVLGRAGVRRPSAPPPVLPEVSSTQIRELLKRSGQPSVDEQLDRLVPRDVLSYIGRNGLYR